ncbi:mammalian cell entry protein [Mycolicibacterium elephantis]|uniref:mammalian cell entry protein n=1 Tax=Mycolicibacterium elephantis TaxID=81858 RepID=UPI000FE1BC87|nr:mammalian cell entry protein [Mycolicibacterium elephantis]MCV7222078.1 mammalian cell entry protein [Mycolicibacterium elephantis]
MPTDAGGRGDRGESVTGQRRSDVRAALFIGLAALVLLSGLAGWLGYHAHESRQAQAERSLFLDAGRQTALHLTSIDHAQVESDVQRILDSAAGAFYDDFQGRSAAFIEVVKKAQSKSRGRITESALESTVGDQAQVLVAVTVNTTVPDTERQEPRLWRMRLTVQKTGETAKVSDVEFVS